MGQCMGSPQSLPISHFETTNAGWSKEDCIQDPTPSSKILKNILTFWLVGKGCTVGGDYQLTQCFVNESPNYRRVRLTFRGKKIALLQHERPSHEKKLTLKLAPYGIYTYHPNYEGQSPFEEHDVKTPIYLFAKLVPTQFQGFAWEYQRCLGNEDALQDWKPLLQIQARPRGYKFNCLFQRSDKVVIAESIQSNSNQYHDYGEEFPIRMCAGVDEIAILLISTAMEDHRDKLNSANRGTSVAPIKEMTKNGYIPPLERTRDVRGYTQGFCS